MMPFFVRSKPFVQRVVASLLLGAACLPAAEKAATPPGDADVILRAMRDELARTRNLQLNDLPKPYFVSYSADDTYIFNATASLGGLLSSGLGHLRPTTVQIRIGDYKQDNLNCTFSGQLRNGVLPLEDNYATMRTSYWITSDAIYKRATEELTLKRNILRDTQNPDIAPDFAPAPAFEKLTPPVAVTGLDEAKWTELVKRLSARFSTHPDIAWSTLTARGIYSTFRLVNSEGTTVRVPEVFADIDVRARVITPEGIYLHNALRFNAIHLTDLPDEVELTRRIDQFAADLEALKKAPAAEDYSGPVIFEGEAAPAMLAQVLGDSLNLPRKPVSQPGQDPRALEGVWGSKLNARVLPEWVTLIDDPTRTEFNGQPLLGAYESDVEGVAPNKLVLVDKGIFKSFYLTRTPVRDYRQSNGHGRLHGVFGMAYPAIGNLIFQASESVPPDQLKAKMLEMVKANGLKYGLIVRTTDFPSTAGLSELEEILKQVGSTGAARTIAPPIQAYRLYLDGHEELVRDLVFKEFSAKDLRNLVAASNTPYVLNFMNNGARFGWTEASAEAVMSSVVAPALLFDSLDLAKRQRESNRLPAVPPPALVTESAAPAAKAGR